MKSKRNHIDRVVLIAVLFLMVASTVVVYSASSTWSVQIYGAPGGLVNRHILKVLAGLAAIFIAMIIPYQKYKPFTKLAVFASVGLLFVTLAAGGEIKGASRWLSIGGFNLQPSEMAKFALIFHLSVLLSAKKDKINDLKTGFIPLILWVGLIVILVMLQPNFSTGSIIFCLGVMMLFIGGARLKHLSVALLALIPVVLVYMISAEYRMKRLMSYIGFGDGTAVLEKANYQLRQGIIGFGNGGIFGVGMGQSKQRDLFLPESYGDFVFSIVGEEYGFIGTIIVTLIFLLIFLRGFKIAQHAPDDLGRFLAIGITGTITIYALGNALVTLGAVPTTGLPMPFVSYGGSAILFSSFAIGVLLNISSQTDLHPRIGASITEETRTAEPAVGKIY